jgi:hypothetical protein
MVLCAMAHPIFQTALLSFRITDSVIGISWYLVASSTELETPELETPELETPELETHRSLRHPPEPETPTGA